MPENPYEPPKGEPPKEIAPDIVRQVEQDFPLQEWGLRLEQLALVTNSTRIQRCIVWAARGHPWRFDYLCRLVNVDFRDVILEAEYDRFGDRFYDFAYPIGQAAIDPRS